MGQGGVTIPLLMLNDLEVKVWATLGLLHRFTRAGISPNSGPSPESFRPWPSAGSFLPTCGALAHQTAASPLTEECLLLQLPPLPHL